jgi:hypothetical protein
VSESIFLLSESDRRDALLIGQQELGRPANLLEKDLWIVWGLQTIYKSDLKDDLTFKGGTSLSKAYKLINRFSEDIDLTYDIRKLIPDLMGEYTELPPSKSQESKWTDAVKKRLPAWVSETMAPLLQTALAQQGLGTRIEIDKQVPTSLLLHYPTASQGQGYVKPAVILEFGGRSTGEPRQPMAVTCDLAHISDRLEGIEFPRATPLVMSLARTFWEKATAAHVYCAQNKPRGARYARHWFDLVAIYRSEHAATILADQEVAIKVAEHKLLFFPEKNAAGLKVDYPAAVSGHLLIVPDGDARKALEEDYNAMRGEGVLLEVAPPFDDLMAICSKLQDDANKGA